jgi:hypothetical protein
MSRKALEEFIRDVALGCSFAHFIFIMGTMIEAKLAQNKATPPVIPVHLVYYVQ